MAERQQPQQDHEIEGGRDKPVEQEGDKDIKEGGLGGARRREQDQHKPSR